MCDQVSKGVSDQVVSGTTAEGLAVLCASDAQAVDPGVLWAGLDRARAAQAACRRRAAGAGV